MTFDAWWATLELAEQRRVEKAYAIEAFKAGADSRNDEVAELSHKAFYVSNDHKNLIVENVNMREQINALREALESTLSWIDDWCETSDTDFPRVEQQANEALAATEPK